MAIDCNWGYLLRISIGAAAIGALVSGSIASIEFLHMCGYLVLFMRSQFLHIAQLTTSIHLLVIQQVISSQTLY